MKRLNLEEVQEILNFWSIATIRQYVWSGKIPCTKVAGRYYFDEEEIKKFVERLTKRVV